MICTGPNYACEPIVGVKFTLTGASLIVVLAFLRDACSWASDARFCLPFLCLTDSHVSVGPQYRPVAAIAVSGLPTLLQPIKTDPSYQSLLLLGEIGECAHSRKLSAVSDASLLSMR